MANTNKSCHPFFPFTIDFYARALQQFTSPVISSPWENGDNCKTDIDVTYEDENPTSKLNKRNQPLVGCAEKIIFSDHEVDDSYDGRIHSVPYIKNGPYTCSKCKEQFVTSQRFAAHVLGDHYRYETRDQRRRRLMKKVRRRNLTLQTVSDSLTLVPVSSEAAEIVKVAEQSGKELVNDIGASCVARVSHQGGEGLRSHYQGVAPGMEANGIKIKSEPYA